MLNSNQGKVETLVFVDAQGQLTLQPVVRSCPNSNSSKLLCTSLLPVSIIRIGHKQPRKSGDIVFPIVSLCFFSLAQGQLIRQLVVGSGRISNSFEISCMSS